MFGDGMLYLYNNYHFINPYISLAYKNNSKYVPKISAVEITSIIFLKVEINETAFVYEVNVKILLVYDPSYIERDTRNRKKIT